MHPDLERLLSEDEAARAGVDAARARAHVRLEEARGELIREREMRQRTRQDDLEATLARIAAEGEHDAARRQGQREIRAREAAAAAAMLVEAGADLWTAIVRTGKPPGSGR